MNRLSALVRPALLTLAATLLLAGPAPAAEPEYPKLGPDIYDTKADGHQQIAAALKRAGAARKHVLLMFGANWCIWCHRLHATLKSDTALAAYLASHYEVVLIDLNTRNGTKRNASVNERYGNPMQHGLPVLVVLDAAGKPLTTQETGALESGAKHDPRKVMAFLEQWAPKSR
jgi:thiol:disulfide interchange protein